jgi:hypothetical protein
MHDAELRARKLGCKIKSALVEEIPDVAVDKDADHRYMPWTPFLPRFDRQGLGSFAELVTQEGPALRTITLEDS